MSTAVNLQIYSNNNQKSAWDKVLDWKNDFLEKHPVISFVSGTAFATLGTTLAVGASTAALPAAVPIIGGTAVAAVGASVLYGVTNRWGHLPISLICVPIIALFGVEWQYNTLNGKIFKEGTAFTSEVASNSDRALGDLKYESINGGKELPVLTLKSGNLKEMGFAQGLLLGEQIEHLIHHVMRPMISLSGTMTGDYSGKLYEERCKEIDIPDEYLEEFDGLYEGLKAYAAKAGKTLDITKNEIINAHKFTDIYKAIGCQRILGISCFNAMGCSTAYVKKNGHSILLRSLDWPSMGDIGNRFIIRRYTANGRQIESQIFPGGLGSLTAKNDRGLVAIINENGTTSQKGMPYGFFARQVIENNDSVAEAEEYITRQLSRGVCPASSCHLTIADKNEAVIFQFYPKPGVPYIKHQLPASQKDGMIRVTNHSYEADGTILEATICDRSSKRRFKNLTETLDKELGSTNPKSLIQIAALGLESVNTEDTVATAIYDFSASKTYYGNANHFAAKNLHTTLPG